MQGLRVLYTKTGRWAEWTRLVNEIINIFVDPTSDGPLAGREEEWRFVTQFRVDIARQVRQLEQARRLQELRVAWARKEAADLIAKDSSELDAEQRTTLRSLATALHELGEIQRELRTPDCVESYKEALALAELIGDQFGAAKCAYNLGRTFDGLFVPSLKNLDDAERWYLRSFELRDERDHRGRAISLGQLGSVLHGRFKDARAAGAPEAEQLGYLNDAVRRYLQLIPLLPSTAVADLGITHNQLGNIYGDAGDFDKALIHLREASRYMELAGDMYGAAVTQFNAGLLLVKTGRIADAYEYLRAAQRNYKTFGDRASAEMQENQTVIDAIEAMLQQENEQE